jgi:hypothetical protein
LAVRNGSWAGIIRFSAAWRQAIRSHLEGQKQRPQRNNLVTSVADEHNQGTYCYHSQYAGPVVAFAGNTCKVRLSSASLRSTLVTVDTTWADEYDIELVMVKPSHYAAD